MLYKIMYTIHKTSPREAYIYAMSRDSAITVFKKSAADIGLKCFDYVIDCVLDINLIEESIVKQGAYYEAREDQYNN